MSLVAGFSQGESLRKIYPNKDSKDISGICESLTCEWILRHKTMKSEGSEKRIAYIKQEQTILGAEMMQNYVKSKKQAFDILFKDAKSGKSKDAGFINAVAQMKGNGLVDMHNKAFANRYDAYNIVLETTFVYNANSGSATVNDRINDLVNATNGVHTYHIVRMGKAADNGTDGGHTVCCYKSSGGMGISHLYYFDPNKGEYRIASYNVKKHFKEVFAKYSGANYNSVSVFRVK